MSRSTSALAIDALAVARLTRLVTRDRLTRRVRKAAIHAAYSRGDVTMVPDWDVLGPSAVLDDPEAPDLAYLLSCDWCASMYVAVVVLALRRFAPGAWDPIARVLAASYVTGYAASHG